MTRREPIYYLYVMGIADGPSKVGHSASPDRRVKEIIAAFGERVTVTGRYPVGAGKALAAERYAHWLLREYHIHGEWFDVPRDVALAAITRAAVAEMDEREPMPPLARRRRIVGGENIPTMYPKGTRARLNACVGAGEDYSQLIREAVDAELTRRGFPPTIEERTDSDGATRLTVAEWHPPIH